MAVISVTIPDDVLPTLATAIRASWPQALPMSDEATCYYGVIKLAENLIGSYLVQQVMVNVTEQQNTATANALSLAQRIYPTNAPLIGVDAELTSGISGGVDADPVEVVVSGALETTLETAATASDAQYVMVANNAYSTVTAALDPVLVGGYASVMSTLTTTVGIPAGTPSVSGTVSSAVNALTGGR